MADSLVLAWQCGHDYALSQDPVTDVLDDARHASIATPRLSYAERVAQRIAEMEACALGSDSTWRGQYPGGAVDWETGRVIS